MFDFEEELKTYEKSLEVSDIDDELIKSEQLDLNDIIIKALSNE